MLKPAVKFQREVMEKFYEVIYDDDFFLCNGYAFDFQLPDVSPDNDRCQYVVVDSNDDVLAYFSYRVDAYSSCAYGFYAFSFDKGNYIVGKDIFSEMERLVSKFHRVEWYMIGGNPVKRSYDRFCGKHGGSVLILRDAVRDSDGNYRDKYCYEIINPDSELP